MNRLAGLFLAVLAAATAFAGTEDEDTQVPLATPTPWSLFGLAGSSAGGDGDIARQLLREPDRARARLAWRRPIAGAWTGWHAVDLSTSRQGRAVLFARSRDGSEVTMRVGLSRNVEAFRTRSHLRPENLDRDPVRHAELVSLTWSRPISATRGRLLLGAEWRGLGGLQPSTGAANAAGDVLPAYVSPAWTTSHVGDAAAFATIGGRAGPARWQADARAGERDGVVAYRAPDRGTGGLDLRSDEVRRYAETGVQVATGETGLVAGASYRLRAEQVEPRGSRDSDAPAASRRESRLEDADLSSTVHRGAAGVAWTPRPGVRAAFTGTAWAASVDGSFFERRFLEDEHVSRGDLTRDAAVAGARAEAGWRVLPRVDLSLVGRAEAGREDERWEQLFTAPDGQALIGRRVEDVTRERRTSSAEGRVVAGPWRGARLTLGARAEDVSRRNDVERATDSPVFDDRDRRRAGIFGSLRARPLRGLGLDLSVAQFREERDVAGPRAVSRDVRDARARIAWTRWSRFSAFAGAAWGSERLELPPLAPGALSGDYASVELDGDALTANLGLALSLGAWSMSLAATGMAQSGDWDDQLADASLEASGPLTETVRLAARVRHLELRDQARAWHGATGTAATLSLSGTFR